MSTQVKQNVNCRIFSLNVFAVVFASECHPPEHCFWYQTAPTPTTAVISGIRYAIRKLIQSANMLNTLKLDQRYEKLC
jgi:hypothetical protein